MLGIRERMTARKQPHRHRRASKAMIVCEALEGRQLLSRGMGLDALSGGGGGRHSMMAELGPFGGGGSGAMFGGGSLGLRGGMRDPIFLLTASLLNDGSGSTPPPSRSVLSSSAVQSAFQTLESDYNSDVSVGAQPTHASVGQLQDDLTAIRKGTLSGTAATTAIQTDQAAILASLGLTSDQVSQIQSDLQAVQTAIQSASSSSTTTFTSTTSPGATTLTSTTMSNSATTSSSTTTSTGSTTSGSSSNASAIQTAFQALQTDLNNDTPSGAQATHASIGQVEDDLDAISKGTLTGSQAVTTIQTDTSAVLSSMGLTAAQISQIQADQSAIETALPANSSQSTATTSSSSNSSTSPTSIAGVEATMQSVQQYLVGIPGVGSPVMMSFGSGGMQGGGSGPGPVFAQGGGFVPGGGSGPGGGDLGPMGGGWRY
jgi:antitoxin component of RelBE/YafQ-DinJ toxin-antitoxin module